MSSDYGDLPVQTNAADADQVQHGSRVTKERARRRLALWRQLLSTKDGREWVWEVLLPDLGVRQTGLHLDPYQLYALEGRREVGRKYEALLTQEFSRQYLEAQAESYARDEQQRRENAAARVKRTTPKCPTVRRGFLILRMKRRLCVS